MRSISFTLLPTLSHNGNITEEIEGLPLVDVWCNNALPDLKLA